MDFYTGSGDFALETKATSNLGLYYSYGAIPGHGDNLLAAPGRGVAGTGGGIGVSG